MRGTRTIMQAGRLVEDDFSLTVARTEQGDSGPIVELWFNAKGVGHVQKVRMMQGEWYMLGPSHRMVAVNVLPSTVDSRGAVVLEIEEINA